MALVPVMFLVALLLAYALEGAVAPDLVGDDRSPAADLVAGVLVVVPTVVAASARHYRRRTLAFREKFFVAREVSHVN